MRTKNMLALATLATLSLAACSNEEDVQLTDMQDMPITYTAGINELSSRAGTALKEGSFGLYLTTDGTTDPKYTANNLKVTYEGSAWKPASQLLWKGNNTTVTYHAYMPYQSTVTGTADAPQLAVKINTIQTDETMKADDFCYAAEQTATAATNRGSINLAFDHKLAKLTVLLTASSELSEGITFNLVSLANSITSATCNLNNGKLTADTETQSVALNNSNNYTFEGILIPQTFNKNLTINIAASNNKTYQFVSPENLVFNPGKSYQLTLTVGRDKVTMGTITAQPWESVTGGDLVTD